MLTQNDAFNIARRLRNALQHHRIDNSGRLDDQDYIDALDEAAPNRWTCDVQVMHIPYRQRIKNMFQPRTKNIVVKATINIEAQDSIISRTAYAAGKDIPAAQRQATADAISNLIGPTNTTPTTPHAKT